MTEEELSGLSDQELLEEAKKTKLAPITNALFIGFLIGIVIYSAVKNSIGFFTLIPLYFVYKMIQNAKRDKALERLLRERNLK